MTAPVRRVVASVGSGKLGGRAPGLLAAAALLGGCGAAQPPPAAEPAASPAPASRPAGRVIALAHLPEGVVVDPVTGLVAVGLRDPDQLALIDARTGALRRRVRVPGAPRHLALEAQGGPVLLAAERIDRLLRVTLPDGHVTAVPVGSFPHDAAGSGGRVLVGNERGGSVSILAGTLVVATLQHVRQPGGVAPLPGSRVAVVDVRDRTLAVFRLQPPAVVDSIHLGIGPTHVAAVAERLYVVDTEGEAVIEVDATRKLRVTARISAPGSPYAIAVDAERRRLWVTLTARNQLVEYALGGRAPRELARYATVRQPDSVAVDPRSGRVFVAGRDANELQLLDPRR